MSKRIQSFLSKSKAEFRRYKQTGDLDYLAQAGDELHNALAVLAARKIGKSMCSESELLEVIKNIFVEGSNSNILYLWGDIEMLRKGNFGRLYENVYENLLVTGGSTLR